VSAIRELLAGLNSLRRIRIYFETEVGRLPDPCGETTSPLFSSRGVEGISAIDVVPGYRTVWSWIKLALRFPTRGDEEHEGQAGYGRAEHVRAAPS
jgi:hypothetical protein